MDAQPLYRIMILILFIVNSINATSQNNIPTEAFSKLPSVQSAQLSPDGNHIASIQTLDGITYLHALNLLTAKNKLLTKSDNKKFKISWVKWANNDTILISIRFPSSRHGVNTIETRLMRQNVTKQGKMLPVFKFKKPTLQRKNDKMPQIWDNIVSILPDEPNHILLSLSLHAAAEPSVYKIDLNSGNRKTIAYHRPHVHDWLADQQGRVRVAIGLKKATHTIEIFDLKLKKWRKAWTFDSFTKDSVNPLGFGLDPNMLYVSAYHNGYKAIYKVNTNSADLDKELVYYDPNYDVDGGLVYSPKTRDAVGVYHSSEPNGHALWHDGHAKFLNAVNKSLPDTNNFISSLSDNERRYIIYSENSSTPGSYYLGDRDQKTLTPILFAYPALMDKQLASRKLISYTARDGLKLDAYLTTPNTVAKRAKPTIIFPHGGPISRDYAGFDYWAQFFANLGYVVLQPNFRGSSSYGYDYKMRAIGKYGQEMQDDLIDGLDWLVKEGISNPNQVCIVGASYGGYAALLAAAKTPDVFRCAISFAGVSDLRKQRNSHRYFVNRYVAEKQYGSDNKTLDQYSPIKHVKNIKIPILLAHGAEDRVVKVKQSQSMAKKLKREGKMFEYLEFENGTHHLDNENNRVAFFNAMEKFLTTYLQSNKETE